MVSSTEYVYINTAFILYYMNVHIHAINPFVSFFDNIGNYTFHMNLSLLVFLILSPTTNAHADNTPWTVCVYRHTCIYDRDRPHETQVLFINKQA